MITVKMKSSAFAKDSPMHIRFDPKAKGKEPFLLQHLFAIWGKEALGSEMLWVPPILGIGVELVNAVVEICA